MNVCDKGKKSKNLRNPSLTSLISSSGGTHHLYYSVALDRSVVIHHE